MGRPLRLGLLSPYFGSVVGGGEKYLAHAALALRDAFPGHSVEISCPVPVDAEDYGRRLGVNLGGLSFRAANRRVTPAHRFLNSVAPLRPLRNRVLAHQAAAQTARYDVLLAMVYAIPVRTACPRSVMLCQFPYRSPGPEVASYREVICQSAYVAGWVERYWHRRAEVVFPPVQPPAGHAGAAKRPLILSVGRFFAGGHSKRQDFLVEAFRRLCDAGLTGWELHLAGSVHRAAQHRGYFEAVRERSRGYPVALHPDAEPGLLAKLYAEASLYWHAAGYGADPELQPEAMEHFGMTTVEAMAAGAVPLVYRGGGQVEVVEDGVDGVIWSTEAALMDATRQLVADRPRREQLAAAARQAAGRFSVERFRSEIVAAVAPLVREAETEVSARG